jgi:DNA modification methylase
VLDEEIPLSVQILLGDMRLRLSELPDNSVDSVVCDPPYHLTNVAYDFRKTGSGNDRQQRQIRSKGFMNQEWDGGDVAFQPETWAEVFRVLKPGGHLVAFSGTRTYHRMAVAIEDAGFEVRDCIFYCYGSGFPKSHNIGKALDKNGDRCTCPESVPDLSGDLASAQPLPSSAQSNVRLDLLGQGHIIETQGPDQAGAGSVRHLRPTCDPAPAVEAAQTPIEQAVLQQAMLGADPGRAYASDRPAECLGGTAEAGHADGEEPSLERRRDAQEAERELQGRPLREGSAVGDANGTQGRLRDGAPPSHGEDVRVPSDQTGSGEPQGPRPVEQSPSQPGTLSDERRSQTWGGWPLCGGCGKPIVSEGLGSALKPAVEPICLARKPLSEKSIAANVLKWGTGALNIDGCRIGTERNVPASLSKNKSPNGFGPSNHGGTEADLDPNIGRWPANLCHDGSDEVVAGFPETESGLYKAGSTPKGVRKVYGQDAAAGYTTERDTYGDSGSAARFFYCAKADGSERGAYNNHPTVKPIALMRWLVRLVTPKGGTVLDPFSGSGSTLVAADMEQFNAIGCELSPEYAAIAERRVRDAAGMFADVRIAA